MVKKWFCFSDVHGFYKELMIALTEAGFDINNEEHGIISLGDLMDRGPSPRQCLQFVNDMYSKNRAILIRGNHEDLLEDAIHRKEFYSYDWSNGTVGTVLDLTMGFDCTISHVMFRKIAHDIDYCKYMKSTIDYYESDKFIFVHGWIPSISNDANMYHSRGIKYTFDNNWRKGNWSAARWCNGMDCWQQGIKVNGKTICCGHWHSSWGHHFIHKDGMEFPNERSTNPEHRYANFNPFIDEGINAVDACTAYSHKVNCIIIEDESIKGV